MSAIDKAFGNNFSDQLLMFKDYGMIELEKDQALGVYTIRGRIQMENQVKKPLLGYDDLLKNLKTVEDSVVLIHTFLNDNDLFVFFTDREMKKIIGLLSSRPVPLHSQ